ncbi:chemotaxis protein MotB [Terrihabitans soli]|uniref:Chemotaxis protein MotB n=1 Tax=Terrihabitans soli TaxID=708113 RepID=A0A6S6QNA8_9HYPH|nr:flagellar motor protein MotB [Terrihabitans soli]BCJ89407.1 chemotaxis protein MotB [Terrihabitans soli]
MTNPFQPIIIKKIKKAAHAHHGGAWKIAYADFVTAMMAFFLLMWLINMTTQEQKRGLAEYFAPGSTSGAGGVLMGTALDQSGNKSSAMALPNAVRGPAEQDDGTRPTSSGRTSDRDLGRPAADAQANNAMASIRQALQKMPDIAELSNNVVIEQTEEGVTVSLVDEDGRSMFPEGSTRPYERTRRALEALVPALRLLPNRLSVTGHTATAPPGSVADGDPWSLSAGRSLAVREILLVAGLPKDHFASVTGRADTEPLYPDNPYLAPNRRVTITLLNAAPPLPPSVSP